MRDRVTAARRPVLAIAVRAIFAFMVIGALVAGIIGGLLRAGLPPPVSGAWLADAVLGHAFLMICAFMGTVIGIERAVAIKHHLAYVAPAAAGLAGLAMLAGRAGVAAWLAVLGASAFVAVNIFVLMRQRAPHTALLLVGALAWLAGNLLFALGAAPLAVIPWWFSFLVLTIAAERLEMTRLMRRRSGAAGSLYATLGSMLAGAALSSVQPQLGGWLYGLALAALALWLIGFDIARRTAAARGLSRYMAICLLLGYGWLAISGLAWVAVAAGHIEARDCALHALGLGFVFSMMLGHAPVILPALARIKLAFGWPFYIPLALLHASLFVRLALAPFDASFKAWGAAGNAAAIALFALTMGSSAWAWRLRHQVRANPASS